MFPKSGFLAGMFLFFSSFLIKKQFYTRKFDGWRVYSNSFEAKKAHKKTKIYPTKK